MAAGMAQNRSPSPSPKLEPPSLLRWVCSSPWWREVGGQGRAGPGAGEGHLRSVESEVVAGLTGFPEAILPVQRFTGFEDT